MFSLLLLICNVGSAFSVLAAASAAERGVLPAGAECAQALLRRAPTAGRRERPHRLTNGGTPPRDYWITVTSAESFRTLPSSGIIRCCGGSTKPLNPHWY